MHLEMRNILWMIQILLLHIIPRVILLPMMNLILILIITMVSRPHAKVRQFYTLTIFLKKLGQGDGPIFVGVEHIEDSLDDHAFLGFGDTGGRGVGEAVGAPDVERGPETGAVVVVQVEEGSCVEAGYVVLFC
jgi:hypothetical protein